MRGRCRLIDNRLVSTSAAPTFYNFINPILREPVTFINPILREPVTKVDYLEHYLRFQDAFFMEGTHIGFFHRRAIDVYGAKSYL